MAVLLYNFVFDTIYRYELRKETETDSKNFIENLSGFIDTNSERRRKPILISPLLYGVSIYRYELRKETETGQELTL